MNKKLFIGLCLSVALVMLGAKCKKSEDLTKPPDRSEMGEQIDKAIKAAQEELAWQAYTGYFVEGEEDNPRAHDWWIMPDMDNDIPTLLVKQYHISEEFEQSRRNIKKPPATSDAIYEGEVEAEAGVVLCSSLQRNPSLAAEKAAVVFIDEDMLEVSATTYKSCEESIKLIDVFFKYF